MNVSKFKVRTSRSEILDLEPYVGGFYFTLVPENCGYACGRPVPPSNWDLGCEARDRIHFYILTYVSTRDST